MSTSVKIGNRLIGEGLPTYIIAEIGINHNGDLETAKDMIRAAHEVGADAVKFQKRTPLLCVPEEQRSQMRETPWGYISYLDYRYKVEFGEAEYREIDTLCKSLGIDWFASVWDTEAVDFLEAFNPLCYKVPSASLTDLRIVEKTGGYRQAFDCFHRHVHYGRNSYLDEIDPAGSLDYHPYHQRLSLCAG